MRVRDTNNSDRLTTIVPPFPPHLFLRVMETETEILTLGGVEVRRVRHGIYVREDEWQAYLDFNEVRPVIHLPTHHLLLT